MKTPYKLVVLDLDGVLIDRQFNTVSDPHADMMIETRFGSKWNVYYKPRCFAFIDHLYEKGFDVAIWTSARKENVEEVVDEMFDGRDLTFFKSQGDCTREEQVGAVKPMFYKCVDKIDGYSPNEILFIDETYEKMKYNVGAYHLNPDGLTLSELMLLVTSSHAEMIEEEHHVGQRHWITLATAITGVIGILIVSVGGNSSNVPP